MSAPRRTVLVATGSALAPPVLRALLASRHEVVALATTVVPAPRGRVLLGADVVDEARAMGIPLITYSEAALDALRADAVVVACFPRRVRCAAPLALNVHPSLLPRWRGPAPLVWQYLAGDGATGVTVHHLAEAFDAGDVAAQRAVTLDDDLDVAEAETRLGVMGGRLVVGLLDGDAVPRTPQGAGTHQGWPATSDLVIAPTLTARQAYRLVKLAGRSTPLRGGGWCIRDARGWTRDEPASRALRCRDGWLLLGPTDAHRV